MKRNEIIVAIAIIALGLIAPWVLPSVWTTVVSIFCYYGILTIGWNMIFGYTGLFSYGHVAFPAIGGYTSALLAEHLGLSPFRSSGGRAFRRLCRCADRSFNSKSSRLLPLPCDLGFCRGGQCGSESRAPYHRRYRGISGPLVCFRTQGRAGWIFYRAGASGTYLCGISFPVPLALGPLPFCDSRRYRCR